MKNTIELVRKGMYQTELYRSGVKIGTINYSAGESDYYIELDDVYMQTVVDAEVEQLKQLLVQYIEDTSKPSIAEYVDTVSKVNINTHVTTQKNTATTDINNYSTSKKGEINQLTVDKKAELVQYIEDTSKPSIAEYVDTVSKVNINTHVTTQKNTATTDINNYSTSKKGEINQLTVDKKAELVQYIEDTSKPSIAEYVDDKGYELILIGDTEKAEIEVLADEKKEELNLLLSSNNILDLEQLLGKNYKGIHSHVTNYEKGDIYYKVTSEILKFSIPQGETPVLTLNQESFEIKKFKVLEEKERNFELSNYRKSGVVRLNSGGVILERTETHVVGFSLFNSWKVVKLSAPDGSSPTLTITQYSQDPGDSPVLMMVQNTKGIHKVLESGNPVKKITHY